MATIEHLPSKASTDDIIAVIKRDGAVILDNVLSETEIDRLNKELAPFLTKEVYCRDEFTGFKTQRIGALVARSEASERATNAPMRCVLNPVNSSRQ